jgi:Pro-kumamolisin, activation domain/Bacterial Ig-like domain (group 3)
MRLQKFLALPALAAVAVCLCAPQLLAAQSVPDRIVQNVAASKLVSLNDRPAQLKNAVDLGRIAPATPMNGMVLVLQPSAPQQQALATLMKQQQQPGSAEYHKWLTPQQFGEQFGVSQNDLKQVTGWLQSQGFHVDRVSNSRSWVVFSGNSSQVEQAFHTQLHKFSLNGATHLANSTATSIPQALTPVVRGVMSLNDFFSKPNLVFDKKPRAMTTLSNGQYALSPGDYATIYDINPVYKAGINGAGQSIAIVGRSDVDPVDIQDFTALFGAPTINLNIINNGPDPGIVATDVVEQTLDVTWSGAVAPGATIDLVVTGSTATTDGVILSMAYIVDNDLAPIMTTSYGSCEAFEGQAYASYFAVLHEQAAAEGISSFVSAGDSGGAGCDNPDTETVAQLGFGINGVASSPYDVAVGGTEFLDQANPSQYWSPNNNQNGASALSYIPEMAWNESSAGSSIDAGGGGSSIFYGKPAWQTGTGVPQDGARDIPDVSLTSSLHDGYIVCLRSLGGDCSQGFFFLVGGTSAASPSFAGIMALINQKTNTSWGNPDPIIYSLANGSKYNTIFHDITVGNNMVPAASGNMIGYDTGTGYDLATGWGSVDVNQLVNAWVATGTGPSGVSLSVNGGTTPLTVTHGTLLTLASAVSPVAAPGAPTPPAATGDIAYIANSSSGNTALGVATLTAGATTLQTPVLPGGTQTITAHYAGDANYAAQLSTSVTVTVTPENSATNLGSGTSPTIQYGMGKDLDAFVASGSNANLSPNSGTVTFNDGATALATIPIAGGELPPSTTLGGGGGVYGSLTGGAATYTVPYLNVGSHNITAAFSGNASYNASTSAALPVTVTQVPYQQTLVTIESNVLQPLVNTPVALSASVALGNGGSPKAPITGTFTFYDGANTLGTGTISGQSSPGLYAATLNATFTTAGAHYIYAVYNGDTNVAGGAASSAVTLTVGSTSATQTTLTVTSTSQPIYLGQAVTLTANVMGSSSSPAVAGTVTFYDGTTSLGTATVAGGAATLTTSSLTGGTHNIYAAYGGSSNFIKSQSQVTQVTVNDFTLTAGSSSTSVVAGGSAAVPITVTAVGDIPMTVSLTCNGLPSGAACSFSPSKVTPGSASVVSTMVISTAGPTLSPAARSTAVHAALNTSGAKPGSSGMALRFGGAFFLGLPLFGLGWTRKRKFLTAIFGLVGLAVLFGAMGLTGCGGSGSGGQKYTITNPGTPAGTSTVTVTATAGSITHTVTVSLIVQSAVSGQ